MAGLVHVGAWDGREYKGHEGALLLFEPQTGPFEALKANCPDALLVNAALGAEPGEATMHTSHPDHSSSLLEPKRHLQIHPEISFEGAETVKVTTLDAMIRGFNLQGMWDELVIDVQGYELEVLKGATETLKEISRIRCEVNLEEVYATCAQLPAIDAFLAPRFKRTSLELVNAGYGDAVYERC